MMVRLSEFDIVRETWCVLAERVLVAVLCVLGADILRTDYMNSSFVVSCVCSIRCCGELDLQTQHVKDKATVLP